MLQLASLITLMLIAASAMFAWLQSRPSPVELERTKRERIGRELADLGLRHERQTSVFVRTLPQ
ncbi:hypothetical protein ACQ4M4_13920 [Leptolyngbya sp. AN02str]|uniref:hypothetical protein n=1 Tax=Leptolyngbya sp. AN02str TaxID=3423363 RepID=UPI003D31A05F